MARRQSRPLMEDMLAYAEEAMGLVQNRAGEQLAADRMRFLAVCRAAEIVGEAASQIPIEVRQQLTDIAFKNAIGMRHRLAHGYGTINPTIVAETVRRDFPALAVALRLALAGRLPDEPA
jgi:uncharacterized protein with HEPN domain